MVVGGDGATIRALSRLCATFPFRLGPFRDRRISFLSSEQQTRARRWAGRALHQIRACAVARLADDRSDVINPQGRELP